MTDRSDDPYYRKPDLVKFKIGLQTNTRRMTLGDHAARTELYQRLSEQKDQD